MNFLQQLLFPGILAYLTDKSRLSRVFEKMSETGLSLLIADTREFADFLERKEWNLAALKIASIFSRVK